MKNIISIIAAVAVVIFGASTIYAFSGVNYPVVIEANLAQSQALYDSAKELSCEYIGKLTSDCYKKKRGACTMLAEQEGKFSVTFNAQAYDSCFSEDEEAPASKTESPTVQTDPLFFGDGGSK